LLQILRLIHVSDMHLGIFPKAYNKIDPSTGIRIRAEDFTKSFLFVMDFAEKEHVDAVLMCGDVFDRIDPVNRVRKDVLDSLTRLTQKGTKVVIIGGNHDTPRLLGSASPLQLLEHINFVSVYHKPSPEPLVLKANGNSDEVDIYPFPYLPPSRWFDYARNTIGLKLPERELTISDRHTIIVEAISKTLKDIAGIAKGRENRKSILMMHYMIEGTDIGHTEYEINDIVLPRTAVPIGGFSYVACGHVHKHQRIGHPSQRGIAFYSGSTERTSFNEHDEDKGFILLDTSGSDGFEIEFQKVPTRPMKLLEFTMPEKRAGEKEGGLLTEFLKTLEQLRVKGEEKDAIIRILIHNATTELKTSLNLRQDAINELLKNAFHWELDFELRKEEIHPGLEAGEVFLKPSEELARYVDALKINDNEKKRVVKSGEKILEEVLERGGDAQ
jgi:exonuclease SbcD